MLELIITSETRIKLLLRFFLNPDYTGYLRQLSKELGESTNGIRLELNKLSKAKILTAKFQGRKKIYKTNVDHPLFEDIRNIVLKSTGLDKVLTDIIKKIGKIKLAFVRGDYALGKDSGLIDLVIVGDELYLTEIERVKNKTEKLINRKIAVLILTTEDFYKLDHYFKSEPTFNLLKMVNK
jgi:hypothetical protein